MRPDQSRSVDYSKEYSSKANNRITRMLTAGANGIARDQDLYPTFETESSIRISNGVAIKDDELIHIGAKRTGDNWNDFSVNDIIIDLSDANNYIQSSTNPTEDVFEMPGYWPVDSTSARAYVILSFTYVKPEDQLYASRGEKSFEEDGYVRGQLSEEQDIIEESYTEGQSPRYTFQKSDYHSTFAENKTFWPGKNIPAIQPGSITVLHRDPKEVVPDWITYHVSTPGIVSSIKILKNPDDFDPLTHLFLGMIFFKEPKKIVNPVMVFDYLLGSDPLDTNYYVTRPILNFVQKYTDEKAKTADAQNFITRHEADGSNLNKLVVSGTIVDSPPGKITFFELEGFGSYINTEDAIWNGTPIVVTHNFDQYVQIQVIDATSKEPIQAEIIQTLNSFTVALDSNETTPLPITIRY